MTGKAEHQYLSMTELARRLDVPESTMRYYCKRFASFLPYKGEGRRRRYSPETENTLLFIANAMQRSKNATAVELMLQSGHLAAQGLPVAQAVPPAAIPPDTGNASWQIASQLLEIMRRQADALGRIADGLEGLTARLDPPRPADGDGSARLETESLREDIQDLRQQIFTAEKIHQADLEQLRKWLAQMGEAVANLKG